MPSNDSVHRKSLDGLRAVAIIAVMLFHCGAPGFRGGWIGVDVFFVLSGFLITTLLVFEARETGKIHLALFILRRSLRLMPAYILYVSFLTAMIWLWSGSDRNMGGEWSALALNIALWTYLINFIPQGGIWNGQDLTIHLWSLAVEQQYYLIWPFIMAAFGQRIRSLALFALFSGMVMCLIFMISPSGIYKDNMLVTRGFSLLIASSVAIYLSSHDRIILNRWYFRIASIVGAPIIAVLFYISYQNGWSESHVRTLIIPILVPFTCLWVSRFWYLQTRNLVRRVLSLDILVYIGKISYGLYLYHEAIRIATWYVLKPLMYDFPTSIGYAARCAVYFILSFGLAALSYEFYEKRFLRVAERFKIDGSLYRQSKHSSFA